MAAGITCLYANTLLSFKLSFLVLELQNAAAAAVEHISSTENVEAHCYRHQWLLSIPVALQIPPEKSRSGSEGDRAINLKICMYVRYKASFNNSISTCHICSRESH